MEGDRTVRSSCFDSPWIGNDQFAENLLTTVSRTVMNQMVGDYSFDEVIGAKRSDIAFKAREDSQRILDAYACGITVTALQMQRVIPPDRVKPAFDRVNASIQQKQKLENEAEATRNRLIPEARASRDGLIREAEGYASRRRAEATGEIEGAPGQVSSLPTRPRHYPPAALPRGHAGSPHGREGQDDHRQRPQTAPAAPEPRRQGRDQPMNRRRIIAMMAGVAMVLAVPLAETIFYTVNERELAVLLQFGQPVASRTKPGLYFKLPMIQEVMRLPKTLQVWHGTNLDERLVDVPTADGKKVEVTVWAVWRITDPAQFVRTLRTVPNGRVAGQGVRPEHGA